MKHVTKLLAASAIVLSMSAASAQAAIWVGYSLDGGTTITDVISGDPDGPFAWAGTNLGGYETLSVEGDAFTLPALLHSDSVETNSGGAASITFFVTRTGISAGDYHGIYSGFTGNSQQGSNYTVTLGTYLDTGNGVYTGSLLRQVTYTGSGVDADEFVDGGLNLTGPFSVTHRYDISTTNGGSSSPTITQGAVPEPTTWALMILGFGGAGAMLRSSRRRLAVTA